MYELKQRLLKNTFVYKIWFYVFLKQKNKNLRLPHRGDPLYFDGYPRSGNTFTFGLIYRVFPTLLCKVAHHLHTLSALKLALKKNIKTIIIIRNPKDAIISYLYSKKETYEEDKHLLDALIEQYIEYYDFVLNNIDNIRIISFEKFIGGGEREILYNIANYTQQSPQINLKEHVEGFIDFEYFLTDYKNRMKNFQQVQSTDLSSMPNKDRILFKKENINILKKSTLLISAFQLYEQILNSRNIL